ncbi:MAG: polyphenol oxidase family protein [Gemmatimonadetes bacterium]|nr:polyphenol oxidase family protein [Gemmatimonadota bacterium]
MTLREIREEPVAGPVPLYVHPEWAARFPWLAQGTTARRRAGATSVSPDADFDLRLFGDLPVGSVLARWRALREQTGCPRAVHARQRHGAAALVHEAGPPGLCIAEGYDAHVTRAPGVLLTVSVADCVPVSLVDPVSRSVALVHAGWRGAAAGALEAGLAALIGCSGAPVERLHVHLGPAICGRCYEVGPEVHAALGLPVPSAPAPVDLRLLLAGRAAAQGVPLDQLTVSAFCTRCGDPPFFSHRGGDTGRQMGVLGVKPAAAPRL